MCDGATIVSAASPVSHDLIERLFTQARTPQKWSSRPVSTAVLQALYDGLKWGPTSGNCTPARFLFLTSGDAKNRLRPALSAGNLARCLSAPVIALVCFDPLFFEELPRLNADADLRRWFAADAALSEETALRNGTLQGAYLILAARALGLSAAPFSGFDGDMVEEGFTRETGWRVNFLVGIGYADLQGLPPRAARLSFDEACRVL